MASFFTPMMFDFLWEELGLGEHPYPISVPSHGATMNERVSLRHRVQPQLKEAGYKDAGGRVEPKLEAALNVLAFPATSVDAVHVLDTAKGPQSALAASDGETGVLALQDAEGVWLRPIDPDAVLSEILALLPRADRGTARSVTLPLDQALQTPPARVKVPARAPQPEQTTDPTADEPKSKIGQLFGRRKDKEQPPPEPDRRPRRPLSERTLGDPREDYALILAEPRDRGGQIAANVRDSTGKKFRSPVLAWFDTYSGRYLSLSRSGPDGADWVTVAGADLHTLRTRLSELHHDLRAEAL